MNKKKVEQELRENEKKYRTLIENTNDILVSTNTEGQITYISSQIKRLGLSPEEVVSKNVMEFILPEDRERVLRDFKHTMMTGEEFPTEFRIQDKEGRIFWFEDIGRVKRDKTGKIIGLTGILRDITDRKKAEEASKESEESLRLLLENIPDFVISVDRDHKILMINRGVPGVSVEQAIGTKVYNYVEPTHHEIMRESLEKVFQTGKPENYEVLGTGPKGPNTAWYETRVYPNKLNDQVISVTLISSDITERKQTEEAILDAKKKWVSLTENTNDIIMIIDSKGIIQYINRTIPPYTPEKTIGKTVYEYIPKEFHVVMRKSLRKVFKTEEEDSFEISLNIPKLGTI